MKYIDKSVALMGGVDVLVVSVMDYWLTMCEDCTYEEMMRSFNNNFFSVFNANQSVLRYMKETGGKIINFGSGAGVTTKTPGDDPSPYSVAKAAVHSWTKCVAKEWCQYGITANCVLPLALSDASLDFRMDKEAEKKLDERTKIFVNIGRFGDIDTEITPFVVFLATDGSKYMTGQLFNVDGGMVESR